MLTLKVGGKVRNGTADTVGMVEGIKLTSYGIDVTVNWGTTTTTISAQGLVPLEG